MFHTGCATAYTGISCNKDTMTQSNDLTERVDRTEGQIIDLQMTANLILQAINNNSTDIAALLEVSRRNSELGRRNSEAISRHEEAILTLNEAIRSIQASTEHTDRLLDYLIRRDRGQLE